MTPDPISDEARKCAAELHVQFNGYGDGPLAPTIISRKARLIQPYLDAYHESRAKELVEALKMWKAYFQSDLPKTGGDHEASAEAFTNAWFATEQAIKAVRKEP